MIVLPAGIEVFNVTAAGLDGWKVLRRGGDRVLAQGSFGPGAHERAWNGLTDAGLPSPAGIYFARLDGSASSVSEKLLRLR